jgi:hypothetical protein
MHLRLGGVRGEGGKFLLGKLPLLATHNEHDKIHPSFATVIQLHIAMMEKVKVFLLNWGNVWISPVSKHITSKVYWLHGGKACTLMMEAIRSSETLATS